MSYERVCFYFIVMSYHTIDISYLYNYLQKIFKSMLTFHKMV